jgi:hypothetical protein
MNEIIDRDLLIALPQPKDALAVFTSEDGSAIKPFLKMVRDKIDAFKGDASTASGRAAIKSMAHKVAKSKTALEEVGKALADEQKSIPKRIDATRKTIKDTLDAWRDEVRKPVDEWEAAEAARVDRIKSSFDEWNGVIADQTLRPSLVVHERLAELEAEEITEAIFGEFLAEAAPVHAAAIAAIKARIIVAEKHEAEQAELAALRAKEAAREAEERAEQLRKEGERRAREEAEADARVEKERADRKLADEKAAAERRERELIAEKEAAEQRAVDAAAKAKREIEDQKRAEEAETARREADKAHKAKINRAALAALVEGGIEEATAKAVIKLIAAKAIPAVTISY